MKKRWIAVILAACMLLGLLPAALATEETPTFGFKEVSGNGTVFDYFKTSFTAYTGTPIRVVFCVKDGDTVTQLTPTNMSINGSTGVTVVKEAETDYYTVTPTALGAASITVTYNGQPKTISGTVKFGRGWYTTPEPTQMSEQITNNLFTYFGGNRTVYYVAQDGTTLETFALAEESSQFAEKLSITISENKTYASVTVVENAVVDQLVWFTVKIQNGNGTMRQSLQFQSGDPTLCVRFVNYNGGNPAVMENNGDPMTSLEMNPGNSRLAAFYLRTLVNGQFVYNCLGDITSVVLGSTSVSSAGNASLSSGSEVPYYSFEANELGTKTISVTTGTGASAKTYKMDLNCVLPVQGWAKAPTMSEANYINSAFTYGETAETRTVYYILPDTDIFTFEYDGFREGTENNYVVDTTHITDGHYIQLTVKEDVAQTEWVKLYIKQTRTGGTTETIETVGIQMVNGVSTGGNQGDTSGIIMADWGNGVFPVAENAVVDGYTIGFNSDFIALTHGFLTQYGWRLNPDNAETYQSKSATFRVQAGVKKSENGIDYYDYDAAKDVSLKVTKFWLDEAYNEGAVYSLAASDYVGLISDPTGNAVQIYVKGNKVRYGTKLCAQVEVTLPNNTTQNVTVSAGIMRYYDPEATFACTQTSADGLTAELETKLTAALAAMPGDLEQGSVYRITANLPAGVIQGTVKVPEMPAGKQIVLTLQGAARFQTKIVGGIDFNGHIGVTVNRVRFEAAEKGVGRALYNGGGYVNYCTFKGYDVAVDATGEYISLQSNNLFAENKIAVQVDTKDATFWELVQWSNNFFINNGTAVRMKSLKGYAPYQFRITHSNFINNERDFDISGMAGNGTFYMYNNYYGKIKNNVEYTYAGLAAAVTAEQVKGLLLRQPASVFKAQTQCNVVASPRLEFPVRDSAQGWAQEWPYFIGIFDQTLQPVLMSMDDTTPYVNYLTADWEAETEIVQSEADGLLLDAQAFAESGTKQIDVVSVNVANGETATTTLGTWTFD